MKIFFDLLPVILFFIAYKQYGIYTATAVVIAATALQVVILYAVRRKVERQYLFTFLAVAVLGGMTLLLHNPNFIMWKPTIVNWGLASAFLASQVWGSKPMVRRMMESALTMPLETWRRLNVAWVGFFAVSGAANLAVAYTCTENTWVNFRLFGLSSLGIVFIVGQLVVLRGYLKEVEAEPVADVVEEGSEPPGA